jgi:transcriptional regulator with PAS, ATPase and Fis domain
LRSESEVSLELLGTAARLLYLREVDGRGDAPSTVTEPASGPTRSLKTAMLLVTSASGPSVAIALGERVLVGRGEPGSGAEAELRLPDKLLSRQHLTITAARGGHVINDAGSRNGTFLDGRRLESEGRLGDGAIISFGAHLAVFRRVTAAERTALDEEAAAPFGPVATISPALSLVLSKLRRLSAIDAPLLLVGETGVGKEVYARAVHRASKRRGPLVAINCAALPANLVESELFGYARGAHSTATQPQRGLIEAADGGTLLLDEIGDMPAAAQTKLLRFLQGRQITPLGAAGPRRVDVRVVAATNRPLTADVSGGLRADLLARLGPDPIAIPPLRERIEDLGGLIRHFGDGALRSLDPTALRALSLHAWPMNVRELESCIQRAITLSDDGHVLVDHLPQAIAATLARGAPISHRRRARAAPARGELERLMREHNGNVAGIARTLDRHWNTVWRWLTRHELAPERFRKP